MSESIHFSLHPDGFAYYYTAKKVITAKVSNDV